MTLPNTMQIAVSIRRTIVVDNDIDTLYINTTTENISSNENSFLKCFEGGVSADTVENVSLRFIRINRKSPTVLLVPDLSECLYLGSCMTEATYPAQWPEPQT